MLVNCLVQFLADVPIDRLTERVTSVKWSNPDAITALAQAEVLIVDDEVQTRELLSEFCRAQGYTVATAATAHDGRAALTAIARAPRQFGVVITDPAAARRGRL